MGVVFILLFTLAGAVVFRRPPHWCFAGGLLAALVGGWVTPAEAFSGFLNKAVLAVGCLYIVAAGVRYTGALDEFLGGLLEPPKSARFLPWVTAVSSVLNNTPVVGILIAPIEEWCRKSKASPGRLLLPLSYAASLGGMLTLFGTSTNLILSEMLTDTGASELGPFEIAKVGLPCALVGLLFLCFESKRVLPVREPGERPHEVGEGVKRTERAPWALGAVASMVVLTGLGVLPLLLSAPLTAGLMVLTGCCSWHQAAREVNWRVLLLMGSALGLAKAVEKSGLAAIMARGLVEAIQGGSTFLILAALYLVTWLLTEILTNAAAAAFMFPVAVGVAQTSALDLTSLTLLIMIAASASFATPFGNQTNLMVMESGGYEVEDYLALGLPLALLVGVTAVTTTWFLTTPGT